MPIQLMQWETGSRCNMLTPATDFNQFPVVSVRETPNGSIGCCNIAIVVMFD